MPRRPTDSRRRDLAVPRRSDMRVLSISIVVCAVAVIGLAGQVTRAPSRVVEGQVVDTSGSAIGGATVQLTRPAVATRTVATDGTGRFRFRNVAAGEYQLSISHPRFSAFTQAVIVSAESTTPMALTVTLHPTATVRAPQRTAESAP